MMHSLSAVMPGFMPGIHVLFLKERRGWPGHRCAKTRRPSDGYAWPQQYTVSTSTDSALAGPWHNVECSVQNADGARRYQCDCRKRYARFGHHEKLGPDGQWEGVRGRKCR